MPSFESTIQNNQPLFNVQVSIPNSSLPNSSIGFAALLDMGCPDDIGVAQGFTNFGINADWNRNYDSREWTANECSKVSFEDRYPDCHKCST